MSRIYRKKVTDNDLTFVGAHISRGDFKRLVNAANKNGRDVSEEIKARLLRESKRIFVPQV